MHNNVGIITGIAWGIGPTQCNDASPWGEKNNYRACLHALGLRLLLIGRHAHW